MRYLVALMLLFTLSTTPSWAVKPDVDRALNQIENSARIYLAVSDDYLKRIEPRLPEQAQSALGALREDRNDYLQALQSAIRRTKKLKRPDYPEGVEQIERVTTHYMNRMRQHISYIMAQKASAHHSDEGRAAEQRLLDAYQSLRNQVESARTSPEQAAQELNDLQSAITTYAQTVETIFEDLNALDETTEGQIWALNDRARKRLQDERATVSDYRHIIKDVQELINKNHDRFSRQVTLRAYEDASPIAEEPWRKVQLLSMVPGRIETAVNFWGRSILPLDPIQRAKKRATLAHSRAEDFYVTAMLDRQHGRLIRADAELYHRAYDEALILSQNSYDYYSDKTIPGFLETELSSMTEHREHLRALSDFQLPEAASMFKKYMDKLIERYRSEVEASQYNVRY